ncbi:MAG: hypothetical protein ACYC5M_14830, partial [Anaerolineae bacterium]
MEYVTLWVPTNDPDEISVPDEVMLRLLRLRWASTTEGGDWSITCVAPRCRQPTRHEWAEAVALEVEADFFCRHVDAYTSASSPWGDLHDDDFASLWRRIQALAPGDLPDLELRNGGREAAAEKKGSDEYYDVQKSVFQENVRRLQSARQALEGALQQRRTLRIVALRFWVGQGTGSFCWAWNYPERLLSRLRLPLFAREVQEQSQNITGSEVHTDALLIQADAQWFQAMAIGSEISGIFHGTFTGVPHIIPEGEQAQLYSPYRFLSPLVYWQAQKPSSGFLSGADVETWSQLADAWDRAGLAVLPDLGLERQGPVLSTWEDAGIWDEYRRIDLVFRDGKRSDGLGEITRAGHKVPVTALVGMAGLVCWEWMRESARRGQVTTGVVTCPLCAKQWARAPKRHR